MLPAIESLAKGNFPIVALILLWALVWKGLSLWRAAKENSPKWFAVLLVLNTAGLLETCYLMYRRKERWLIWPILISAALLVFLLALSIPYLTGGQNASPIQ